MQLAELVDVDITTVQRWEADKRLPYSNRLKYLSDVLEVSIDYILYGKEG